MFLVLNGYIIKRKSLGHMKNKFFKSTEADLQNLDYKKLAEDIRILNQNVLHSTYLLDKVISIVHEQDLKAQADSVYESDSGN